MNRILLGCLLTGFLSGCGPTHEEILQMATTEYERKAALLRKEQEAICKKTAFAEAERQADSIIFQMRINPLKKPLYRPPVPPKPTFVPTDSTRLKSKHSVKPILDPPKNNR